MRGLLKKSEWERSIVDVNDIVTSVTRLLESEARLHRVSVALDLASGPLPVVADPIQVQQVVLNLLRNAIEASSDGTAAGSVTVSTAKVQRDEIELEVCDSGCGIDPVNMSRIFEPFFTTKGDGLGMGLAISRSIINAHGGRLMALNNADRGATFRCALPEARQANVSDPGHAYVSGGRSV
jgi:signal transduction histidine kinase